MKNDSNPIIRSEEVTIDMHICAALSESRSSGEIYFAAILTAALSDITSTMQSKKTCPAHHLGF